MSKGKLDRACVECVFARWVLTPTGRITRNVCGECVCDFDQLVAPVLAALPSCVARPVLHKGAIWPQYEHCPAFVQRDTSQPLLERGARVPTIKRAAT